MSTTFFAARGKTPRRANESQRLQPRQPHDQVDEEEGEGRYQPHRERVEGAVALDAGVERPELVAEAPFDGVPKEVARDQKGKRGTDRGGGGGQQGARDEAEWVGRPLVRVDDRLEGANVS